MNDGTLDVTNTCVEVSDVSLQYVNYAENLYPCLVHENRPAVGWSTSNLTDRDTDVAVKLRKAVFDKGELYEIVSTSSDAAQMVVGRLSADRQYAVLVSTNLHQIRIAGMVMNQLLPAILGLVLLISLAASIWFGDWFTQPISELSAAARRIAKGDYSARVSRSGQDEMGQLAQDFNRMAAEVERTSQLQQELLANVSHDLRTPLTSISGNAGILMEKESLLDEDRKHQMYTSIYEDAIWLNELVENLLSVTRIENGTMELKKEPELLEEVIREAVHHLDRKAGLHQVEVELPDDLLMALMDARLIGQVLINIINNAVKYTQEGSRIVISARRVQNRVLVEIADDGPGVPDEAKDKLFDMFYTVGKAGGDGRRGLGLGLALCKSIIHAHGGQIGVRDNVPKGSVFYFTLQLAEVKMYE